ncbi:MAG TPA: hypothetical protein PKJ05_06695 [Bacillota bacterium]|nr:hypothetical protein [Bacillota bacterium]
MVDRLHRFADKVNARVQAAEGLPFALFMYAPLLVDIVRKLAAYTPSIPQAASGLVRNLLYVAIFLFAALKAINARQVRLFSFVAFVFLAIMGVSVLASPGVSALAFETILIFLSRCLVGLYFGHSVRDFKRLVSWLKALSVFALIYAVMIILTGQRAADYMTLSYNLLVPLMIATWSALNEKNIWQGLAGIIFLFTVLAFGARGPLLCYFAFAGIYLVKYFFQDFKRTYPVLEALLAGALLASLNLRPLLDLVNRLLPSSRTLSMALKGDLLSSSGRAGIYKAVWEAIKKSPLSMKGLLADRIIVSEHLRRQVSEGYYAHNLFLELSVNFGVVIGAVLTAGLLLYSVLAYLRFEKMNDRYASLVYAVFASYVLVEVQVSSSYLTNAFFWVLVGLIWNAMSQKEPTIFRKKAVITEQSGDVQFR